MPALGIPFSSVGRAARRQSGPRFSSEDHNTRFGRARHRRPPVKEPSLDILPEGSADGDLADRDQFVGLDVARIWVFIIT